MPPAPKYALMPRRCIRLWTLAAILVDGWLAPGAAPGRCVSMILHALPDIFSGGGEQAGSGGKNYGKRRKNVLAV